MTDEFLTADEVARLLKISANTVRTMASQGKLPHVRAGRRYVFSIEAIRKWATA